jgi:aldehyde:ferredoxin oxidoreductase
MFGIAGKILRVDLSSSRFEILAYDEAFYRNYLGGEAWLPIS